MKKYFSKKRFGIFLCMVMALVCLSYGCGGGARDIILIGQKIVYASGDADSAGKIYFTSQSDPCVIIQAFEEGTLPEKSTLTLKERELEIGEVGDYGSVSSKVYTLTGTVEKSGVVRPLTDTMKAIEIKIPNRFSPEYTQFWLGFKKLDDLTWQYQKISEDGGAVVASARMAFAPKEFVIKTYRLDHIFTVFAVKPEDLISERIESFALTAEPMKYESVASESAVFFCEDLVISSFVTANDSYVFNNPNVVHELTFVSDSNQGAGFKIDGGKANEQIYRSSVSDNKYVHKFIIDRYAPDNSKISGTLATFSFVLNLKDVPVDVFPDEFKVMTSVITHKGTMYTYEEAFIREKNASDEPHGIKVRMIEPNPVENVATNTRIVLCSEKEILWDDSYESYIKLYDENNTVASFACTISDDKKEIIITPVSGLKYETTYTVALKRGIPVCDSDDTLDSGTFNFVTWPATLTMASIAVTDDSLHSGSYKTNPKFVINFGKPVGNTVEAENAISVMSENISVPFVLKFDSHKQKATLSFNDDLMANTKYIVSMSRPVKSIENLDIAPFSVVNFTTLPDVTADMVMPVDKQNASVDAPVIFKLSSVIDWEGGYKDFISIKNLDGQSVVFDANYDSSTGKLSIVPSSRLQYDMTYTVSIVAGIMNHESWQKLKPCSFSFKTNNINPDTDLEIEHVTASLSVASEDYVDATAEPPVITLGARFIVDFKIAPRDLSKAENAIRVYSRYDEATKLSTDWSEDKTKLTFTISSNMASESIRVDFYGDIYDSRNVLIDHFAELKFETTPFAGEGTAEKPYEISTPMQLDLIRNYLTAHYKQINDIDLTDYSSNITNNYRAIGFMPLGTLHTSTGEKNFFSGTYDGQNYKITGFWQDMTSVCSVTGLFGGIEGEDVCIKNVHLDNPGGHIYGSEYLGSICGYMEGGKILNCSNNIPIQARDNGSIGGIVAYVEGNGITIDGCINEGEIVGGDYGEDIGGIVGVVAHCESITISNCKNLTSISGNSGIAGIVSSVESDNAEIINCRNEGDLSSSDIFSNVSGIVMGFGSGNIVSCVNTGNITGSYVSGIAGEIMASRMDKCCNLGNIESQNYASGLCEYAGLSEITNCYNTGDILGFDAYGMFQYICDSRVDNCYVEASIIAVDYEDAEWEPKYRSGIFGGGGEGESKVINCFTTKKSVLNNITDITTTELFSVLPDDPDNPDIPDRPYYETYCENCYILNQGYSDEITATVWASGSSWSDSSIWTLDSAKLPELVPYTE